MTSEKQMNQALTGVIVTIIWSTALLWLMLNAPDWAWLGVAGMEIIVIGYGVMYMRLLHRLIESEVVVSQLFKRPSKDEETLGRIRRRGL